MTVTEISEMVDDLVALALEGKWEIAFQKYYSKDLEKSDLDGVPVKGIEQNIINGRSFASKISNLRDFSCAGKVVKDNRSFVMWSFDFDVDENPFKVVEVAIQDWEDGKIVKERFFA